MGTNENEKQGVNPAVVKYMEEVVQKKKKKSCVFAGLKSNVVFLQQYSIVGP